MKRQFLLYSLLLPVMGGTALAQTVSQEDAAAKALRFLSHGQHAPGISSAEQLQLAYKAFSGDENYFYVFNYGQDNGYIIVGGDEAAQEILGYGEEGHFDYDQLPPQMKWWLGQYEQQIGQAIRSVKNGEMKFDSQGVQHALAVKTDVSPLLGGIVWDQALPYNALIPGNEHHYGDDSEYATGCVATAMAQVMKKWSYPAQGIGRKKYTNNGRTYEADFGSTTYDFASMTNTYGDSYSGTAAQDAVATLMYHAGVSVNMNYGTLGTTGSGAAIANVAKAMSTYFGYSQSATYQQRDYYSDAQWEDMVYQDIQAGNPVIYGGQAAPPESGGHCFVLDGYKASSNTFHINWGWSGYCNNYFVLSGTSNLLKPNGTGSGGSGAGASYRNDQEAVFGLVPDPLNEGSLYMPEEIVLPNEGYVASTIDYTVKATLANPTSTAITRELLYFFFPDDDYNSIASCYVGNVTVPAHGEKEVSAVFKKANLSSLVEGKNYLIALYDISNYPICDLLSDYYYLYWRNENPITATVTDAEWRTICLPYEAAVPTGWKVYEVTGVSGSTLVKSAVDKIEMNKPYLVNAPAGNYDFKGPETYETLCTNGILTGSTYDSSTKYAPAGSYVMQKKGTDVAFYQVQSSNTQVLSPFTAYLTSSLSPSRLGFIDDDATSIEMLENDTPATVSYNVSGQRVQQDAKGLVIKNGKLNFCK